MNAAPKQKKIVIVAHGSGQDGGWSLPNVKIITKSKEPLSFTEAIDYMKNGGSKEYASSSIGTFGGLSDADCRSLFNNRVPGGVGLVATGMKLAKVTDGPDIYAWRGDDISFTLLALEAKKLATDVVLVACRN